MTDNTPFRFSNPQFICKNTVGSDLKIADDKINSMENGASLALAERIYTSRLIGEDPDLVMHGGGNTSCKSIEKDIYGTDVDVLCIKGSGWDLRTIEAEGLPAVRLKPLQDLRELSSLADKDMINILRSNLLDQSSPNPSVETLLHAFLPQKVVDHTHSTPFLTLANLPNAEEISDEIFEGKMGVVPYIMPGFALAKLAADIYDSNPGVEGLLLLQHGHFTWGHNARSSYERMIEQTRMVDNWLCKKYNKNSKTFQIPSKVEKFRVLNNLQAALRSVSNTDKQTFVFDLIDEKMVVREMNDLIANDAANC